MFGAWGWCVLPVSLPWRGWEKQERVTARIGGISVMETNLQVRDCDGSIPFMWWQGPFLAVEPSSGGYMAFICQKKEQPSQGFGSWRFEGFGVGMEVQSWGEAEWLGRGCPSAADAGAGNQGLPALLWGGQRSDFGSLRGQYEGALDSLAG